MGRRCVICGKNAAENDCDNAFHYPKNETEARIWQRSMSAYCVSLDRILKQCCVCIEHIPQFVDRAQKQANNTIAKLKVEACERKSKKKRPTLNVLLLQGATLPAYCGKSQEKASTDESQEPDDNLDEEIIVRESSFKDLGSTTADIEETEITVLRTPLHDEEELQKLQENKGKNAESGDTEICTDVLLLGRSLAESTDKCPTNGVDSENFYLQAYCNPRPEASDCEQQDEIIKQQQNRICELEDQICRQNYWQLSMQQKMAEMYSQFGHVEDTGTEDLTAGYNKQQHGHQTDKPKFSAASG